MNVLVGDLRRLPIPVLTPDQSTALNRFGAAAVAAKEARDRGEDDATLPQIEAELDLYVRDLYGIARDAELWVVR